jgi:CheY-like chemotaxis protein
LAIAACTSAYFDDIDSLPDVSSKETRADRQADKIFIRGREFMTRKRQRNHPGKPTMARAIRPAALIVDDDTQQNELIGTLLRETGLEVIQAVSSEEAVNILRVSARKIVFLVAAMELPSFMDGARLAVYAQQWPWIRIVVISYEQPAEQLPHPAVAMRQPWLPLNMLIQAEKAIAAANHDLPDRAPKVWFGIGPSGRPRSGRGAQPTSF